MNRYLSYEFRIFYNILTTLFNLINAGSGTGYRGTIGCVAKNSPKCYNYTFK